MKLAVLLLVAVLSACTSTNYGTKPQPLSGEAPNTYKFKMFVGGFSGGDTADESVARDLEAFQKTNGFTRYRIVRRQYNAFPSSYEYVVEFLR